MFGLFKKSDQSKIKVVDKVWMSKKAKFHTCTEMLKVDQQCIFIVWFEASRNELIRALNLASQNNTVFLVDDVIADQIRNHIVVFAEHYPLSQKEQQQFKRLMLSEVNVLSSMDEPFFKQFGGETTLEVMRKLGMKEDEVIGHPMINRAIKNAQDKIEKMVAVEKFASSQEAWFHLNLGNRFKG